MKRATRLFEALSDYFRQNPKEVSDLMHEIVNSLINEIINNVEYKKELGYPAGKLEILSNLIWYHDKEDVIQKKLTEPDTLEDVLNAISKLAEAFSFLKSGRSTAEAIEDLINDAVLILYKIVESTISNTSDDDP